MIKSCIATKYGVRDAQEMDSTVKVQLLDAGSVLVQRFLEIERGQIRPNVRSEEREIPEPPSTPAFQFS